MFRQALEIAPSAEVLATGLCLSQTLGMLGLYPVLLAAYLDGSHLPLSQAGLLISVEVAVCVVTLIANACRGEIGSHRRRARAGALLAGVAYLSSAIPASSFGLLLVGRVGSGAGMGLLGAAVNSSVAQARVPERLYASGLIVYGALGTALLAVLPMVAGTFGYGTLFAALGALFFATALMSSSLNEATAPTEIAREERPARSLDLRRPATAAITGGCFLLWIASSLIWVFAERKAAAIGMQTATTGLTLAAANVVGLLGSGLTKLISLRIGRAIPVTAGGLVLAVTFCGIGAGATPVAYIAWMIVYGIAYFFLLPYVLGVAAALDRYGRVAVANSLMPWAAHLVTPLLGAILLQHASFSLMGALSASLVAIATGLVVAANRSARRHPADRIETQS